MDNKSKNRKKLYSKIVSRIFFALLISFLAIYLSTETGYYDYRLHSKMVLTDDKIKEFERDVKDGKEIDINNYVLMDNNYSNKVSKFGDKISNSIEKLVKGSLDKTFKLLSKVVEE